MMSADSKKNNFSFFSVLDRQLESFISYEDFEKSLYLNLLFQDRILVPDIFFFISTYLSQHIKQYGSSVSLFEVALQQGLIVPSFRDANRVNFLDILDTLTGKGDSKSVGIQGIIPNAKQIAERLNLCAERVGNNYTYTSWPTNYMAGDNFDKLLRRGLLKERTENFPAPPGWIIDVIDRARELTKTNAGSGLRRGDLYNAIAYYLGLENSKVNDIRVLLLSIKGDKKLYQELELFLQQINECYHLNLSVYLGSNPNYPRLSQKSVFLQEILLEEEINPASHSEPIEETVPCPSLEALKKIRPQDLVSIIKDEGHGYIAARRVWEKNPTPLNSLSLRDSIRSYAKSLSERVKRLEICDGSNFKSISGENKQSREETINELRKSHCEPQYEVEISLSKNNFFLCQINKQITSENFLEQSANTTSAPEVNFFDIPL